VHNNLIHDIDGAGFGVWGCYDCTFAYNTLVRVGRRSHVIEVKFGEHSCDGEGGSRGKEQAAASGSSLHCLQTMQLRCSTGC
jgi:hypothetical protein